MFSRSLALLLRAWPGEDSASRIQACGKVRSSFPPVGQGVWTRRAAAKAAVACGKGVGWGAGAQHSTGFPWAIQFPLQAGTWSGQSSPCCLPRRVGGLRVQAWAEVRGERRCLNCFAPIESENDRKKFCSERCRNATKQRRHRERAPEAVARAQQKYWKSCPED